MMKTLSITTIMSGEEMEFKVHYEALEAENSKISNELTSLKDKMEIQVGFVTRADKDDKALEDTKEKHAQDLETVCNYVACF